MPQYLSLMRNNVLDTFAAHGSRDGIGLDIDFQEADELSSNELDMMTDAILQLERKLGGGIGAGTGLWDADRDTGVQVEEGADDDIFRVDTAGTERMVILANGKIGFGTPTVPHGAVGAAMLALEGANASVNGPHVQFTTATDDYPLLQILPFQHDLIIMYWDSYYDGTDRSSDVGSNFRFIKQTDLFRIQYDSAIAQGNVVTFNDGIALDVAGNLGLGSTIPGAGAVTTLFFPNTATAPGASANLMHIYCQDRTAGLAEFCCYQEEVVVADGDETKFNNKWPVRINGTDYFIMLTTA